MSNVGRQTHQVGPEAFVLLECVHGGALQLGDDLCAFCVECVREMHTCACITPFVYVIYVKNNVYTS